MTKVITGILAAIAIGVALSRRSRVYRRGYDDGHADAKAGFDARPRRNPRSVPPCA